MATQTERYEPVEVNILEDADLPDGASTDYDLGEDFYAKTCPPPGRTEVGKPRYYKVKLFLDADTWEKNLRQGFKTSDPTGWYYTSQIACKLQIQDEKLKDYQDYIGYFKISTAVPKGKKMSSAMMVLRDLKAKIPTTSMSDKQLAQFLTKVINKLDGPEMIADCDWQAWDKTKTSKRAEFGSVAIGPNGKILSSMANFPKKADGSYEHIIFTKEGLQVTAGFKVLRLLPIKASEKPKAVAAAAPASKPKPKPEPVVEEEVEVEGVSIGDDGEVILDV